MGQVGKSESRLGFQVEYADGTVLNEWAVTWDELPTDRPIRSLSLVDLLDGKVYFKMEGARRYFFSNEGIAVFQVSGHQHSGKVFGMVDLAPAVMPDERVTEIHVDLLAEEPKAEQRIYPITECPFAPHAFRPGMAQA